MHSQRGTFTSEESKTFDSRRDIQSSLAGAIQ